VLVSSLQRCLAADVFLRPLADKFTRLALQLVARYAGWLSRGTADSAPGGTDTDKVNT
jgi:conserved oligomeric Golgi complex subunit 2